MAQASACQHLKLLLLGKTGHGKSATGNSILGRTVFASYGGPRSVTEKIRTEFSEIGGHKLKVIDGPGLEDTSRNDVDDKITLITSVRNALLECGGFINGLVLVIKYGERFTDETKNAVDAVMTIIGSQAMGLCGTVVVTNAISWYFENEGKAFEEWCREKNDEYGGVFEECGYRCVLFENTTRNEIEKKEQRDQLLRYVSETKPYTNENFKGAEEKQKEYIASRKCLLLKEEYQSKISLLIGNIQNITPTLSWAEQRSLFTEVEQRANNLLTQAEEDDAGSGVLASLQEQLRNVIREAQSGNAEALKEAAKELQDLKDARKAAAWKVAGYSFLTFLTLGIAYPWLVWAVQKLKELDEEIEKGTL